jgi:hypothetical protein
VCVCVCVVLTGRSVARPKGDTALCVKPVRRALSCEQSGRGGEMLTPIWRCVWRREARVYACVCVCVCVRESELVVLCVERRDAPEHLLAREAKFELRGSERVVPPQGPNGLGELVDVELGGVLHDHRVEPGLTKTCVRMVTDIHTRTHTHTHTHTPAVLPVSGTRGPRCPCCVLHHQRLAHLLHEAAQDAAATTQTDEQAHLMIHESSYHIQGGSRVLTEEHAAVCNCV